MATAHERIARRPRGAWPAFVGTSIRRALTVANMERPSHDLANLASVDTWTGLAYATRSSALGALAGLVRLERWRASFRNHERRSHGSLPGADLTVRSGTEQRTLARTPHDVRDLLIVNTTVPAHPRGHGCAVFFMSRRSP